MLEDKDLVSIQQARTLVENAHQSLLSFKNFSQQQVDQIVMNMANKVEKHARRLAEMAVEETGYGKVEDKTIKNLFAAVDIYKHIKDMKTCDVIAENKKKRVVDIAVPAGVIAVITPTTNPTSTAIFKILCALKGRNTVVVSPHPNAVQCTCEAARIMYEAALQAGAPEDCINWIETVTLGLRQKLQRPTCLRNAGRTALHTVDRNAVEPRCRIGFAIQFSAQSTVLAVRCNCISRHCRRW